MEHQSHTSASGICHGSLTEWSTPKVAVKNTTRQYFKHFSAQASSTNTVLTASLKEQYPNHKLSVLSEVDLLGFAANGNAKCTPLADDAANTGLPSSITINAYNPPSQRVRGGNGFVSQDVLFGKFHYNWQARDFIMYIAHGIDGASGLSNYTYTYLLSSDESHSEALVIAAGKWTSSLHEEIWVFDSGYWSKNAALYQSVMKASWDIVILDAQMKKDLINDHLYFFQSKDTYRRLKVPWKRGIIYYGPPGNGKTISIKAMMHTLYDMKPEIQTLYVRSLSSSMGPEYSIKSIFSQARQHAPCYLVFEDLDSLVSDSVRSYFLNEVDGLRENDGIFMIGSTNHLERLDPGISNRPSRFDRKYLFPNPSLRERIAYCHFWQAKLKDNKEISFPDKLCDAIAGITSRFSFAYIQEAFVAALLAIARDEKPHDITAMDVLTVDVADDWVDVVDGSEGDEDPELEKLVLWREMKKQVKILRQGLSGGDEEADAAVVSL